MASISKTLPFFLFLVHFLLPAYSDEFPTVIAARSEDKNRHGKEGSNIDIEAIASALSDKGYLSMALTLRLALKSNLIPSRVSDNNSGLTIFCPPNGAFLKLGNTDHQTPLTFLQHHISPFELKREALESSPGANGKVNTLLSGHSLVITTEPGSGEISINEVKITEWDVYDDGSVTVHGVEDFLDPNFQALPHPWHDEDQDDKVIKNEETGLSQKEDLLRMLLYAVIVAIFLGYPQAGLLLIIIWLFMPSRFCTCRP